MKLNNTENLKTQLGKLAADIEATKDKVQGRSEKESHHSHEISVLRQARKEGSAVAPAKTQERSVIRTPGRTKQKGMFSRRLC